MTPEALDRLWKSAGGHNVEWPDLRALLEDYRLLTERLADARALNDSLAAQVDDARRQRDECAAKLEAFKRSDEARAAVDVEHVLQLTSERNECAAKLEALGLDRWPVLVPFIAAMVRKLDANKPKKGGREGWQDDHPANLVERVRQEADELLLALDDHREADTTETRVNARAAILHEAADVANMAMMVADASGALDATEPTPLEAAVASASEQTTARATLHAMATAVTVERIPEDHLVARCNGDEMALTTAEAAALITALLADGRVHAAWLHGRGGR